MFVLKRAANGPLEAVGEPKRRSFAWSLSICLTSLSGASAGASTSGRQRTGVSGTPWTNRIMWSSPPLYRLR
jgi:hypothetical protein